MSPSHVLIELLPRPARILILYITRRKQAIVSCDWSSRVRWSSFFEVVSRRLWYIPGLLGMKAIGRCSATVDFVKLIIYHCAHVTQTRRRASLWDYVYGSLT
jgi:hypothetical protein